MWCASSRAPRSRTPWPCKFLFGQGTGGSLVVYHLILEMGGSEVLIDTTAMVFGLVVEMDEN